MRTLAGQRKFAVFDIDGTLIRWQLYHAIFHELAKGGKLPKAEAEAVKAARATWKQRGHRESFKSYEHILWQTYMNAITTLDEHDVESAVNTVFETYKDQVYTYTRDLIRQLKADGYLLFTLSGSHQEIVAKLAEYYGFDDAAGTVYLKENGTFTGKEDSVLGDKGAALKRLAEKHGASWQDSIAVGDSKSDAKMLELVERPIAFNPDQQLLDIATTKGWDIVVERKNVIYQLHQADGHYILA
ncbi:MAG TPA: HAD family phosphatase [Candidatus Saccharimonadales bacterium]|nr:HAD family phosphatase [Candidatus Saccharimonadales bacterium]